MLYLFFGEDTFRSRQALHEFIKHSLADKKQSLSLSWLTPDIFDKNNFEEFLRTKNLFGGSYVVVCESLFQETNAVDFLTDNMEKCAGSENTFLFWEESLEAPFVGIFKKNAEKINQFSSLPPIKARNWLEDEIKAKKISLSPAIQEELIRQYGKDLWSLSQELEKYALTPKSDLAPLKAKTEEVNIFHITDAIAQKDKSRAWFLFQKALMSGMDAEEIFWKIVWQIKNTLLLKQLPNLTEGKIAEKTGLHPYVIKKTASASRLFSKEELSKYSSDLIEMYHNARKGLADFDIGIEKFLIRL